MADGTNDVNMRITVADNETKDVILQISDAEQPQLNDTEVEESKVNGNKWEKFIIITESIAFVCVMGLLIASLTADRLQNSKIWDVKIWKWCLLLLAILCGRLFAYMFTYVLISLIRRSGLVESVIYCVYGVKKSIMFFIWLGLVTLAWGLLFNFGVNRSKDSTHIVHKITRGLGGCLIGAAIWLLKSILVWSIGSVHAKKLFSRIKEAKCFRNILRVLSVRCDSGSQEVENVHAEIMEDSIDLIRGHRLRPLSYKDNGIDEKITDEDGAYEAAYKIFNKLPPGNDSGRSVHLKHLVSSIDIQHLQGEFNTDLDKPMSRSDFRDWVVDNFNNYEMLKSILEHKKTAIDELNVIASLMVVIVIIIVWLLFMGFLTTKVLVFISSQILLIAFVFGNSAKNVFEAVIFVFVVHLFDVGDRCIIDGTTMTVDEMTIMTTKFKRDDDGELICYPNAVLATTPIKMLYKIPQKSDCLEFGIDVSTPQSAFERLQHRIKRYLQENPRRWQPEHSIQVMAIDDNKMTVALHVNHTINYRHRKKRAKRRSDLLLEMRHIFQDLGIQYNLPRQRVHLFFEGGNALTPLSVFQ